MRTYILFIIIISLMISSCDGGSTGNEMAPANAEAAVTSYKMDGSAREADESGGDMLNEEGIDTKIIKNGNMTLKVKGYAKVLSKAKAIAKKLGGHIEDENLNKFSNQINAMISIRIPSENFETLANEISEIDNAVLENKSVSSNDVTATYIDISTRLENKRLVEKRYRELLAKASSISDIISVEEKLRLLREEIESAENQLKYYDSQVAYSTLHLTILEELDYNLGGQMEPSYGSRILKSMEKGWDLLLDMLLTFIRIWPILLILIVVIYFAVKKSKKKKQIVPKNE